jgi:phospholipid/cholesterol/gamma-HCH transport system substrate-binding protein
VINELQPATKQFTTALPKLSVSFSVLNEFFNELAYNPGASKGGFLFFLDWGNHNLNSVVSSADAHGPLGRTLVYFNCEILKLLSAVSSINPSVNLLVGLLKPPSRQECINLGLLTPGGQPVTSALRSHTASPSGGGVFSGLAQHPFSSPAAKKGNG